MKHVELYETTRNGIPTFRLLCPDQAMSEFFDSWAYQLAKLKKFRTVKAYCYAVQNFLSFIHQVSILNCGLTPALLNDALDSYESYLVFGASSDSAIAREAAKALGSRNISGASVGVHLVAVNRFIAASEAMRDGLLQMQRSGYVSEALISIMPITITRHINAPKAISASIKANSWLAGCIAGGAKKIKMQNLSPKSKPSSMARTDEFGGDDKAFPIDKCKALIDSAVCLRDKVLWSLVAASGCRISEALTMLMDDIEIDIEHPERNKIYIIDPGTRRDVLIDYMSEAELNKLDHKGRDKPETFLIEPFASMFWYNFGLYNEEQRAKEKIRRRPVLHRFLFRNLRNGSAMPLSYQAVWERFSNAARAVTGTSYGFHSLRHMYAYYLVNHCPNPAGRGKFGLELKVVQTLMGHKSIKSTERYARKDAKMLEVTFAAINMLRMTTSNFNVVAVQIQHLECELEQLKLKLVEHN
ncbi:site-specific integrase [Pseudomonas sp. PAMC 26793]|uniref:tyrosine-type recombinase/integrase n=1 Tax=Pseudomonas sp. PAMC 26793 TaxID=1240676 RepID=UPI0005194659|nr:site-specific integrase [Pseudomonas sp. PAMC 26793]